MLSIHKILIPGETKSCRFIIFLDFKMGMICKFFTTPCFPIQTLVTMVEVMVLEEEMEGCVGEVHSNLGWEMFMADDMESLPRKEKSMKRSLTKGSVLVQWWQLLKIIMQWAQWTGWWTYNSALRQYQSLPST